MATGKKPKLETKDVLPQEVEAAIDDLQDVQIQLEKLNDEASDKVLKVEEEYNKLRRPVYSKRADAISRIPDFWYQCFLQHPFLADVLTPEDNEILSYLRQVTVEDFSDIRAGYRILFAFEENPYFSDKELSKSFTYSEDAQLLCSSPGIHWYPGKDPAQTWDEPSARKRPRSFDSFFMWFPTEGEPYSTGQDQIADVIKDHLWVNPLKYFLGDVEAWENEEAAGLDADAAAADDPEANGFYDLTGEEGDYDDEGAGGMGALLEDEEDEAYDQAEYPQGGAEGDEGDEYDEEQQEGDDYQDDEEDEADELGQEAGLGQEGYSDQEDYEEGDEEDKG